MSVKKIFTELFYNKHNVSNDFSPYLQSVSYTDYEEESSDELSITLRDNKKLFQNTWYPEKGAKLTCNAGFKNTPEIIKFGTFTIDEINFNFSKSGDSLEIKALAATTNSPLRTANTTFFANTTLFNIAKKFGKKYGFDVVGGADVEIERINQVNETDLNFLRRVAKNYGYIFKLTECLLTFLHQDELTGSKSLFTLTKNDISNLSISDESAKMYKACSVKYFNPKTKKLCNYTEKRANGSDTLKITQKCTSLAQAKRIAKANLKNGSREVKGSITLAKVNVNFVAGVNFEISGFGRFDGKYHIKQSTHNISNDGWEITGEIIKC